jgi:MFS family permease
MFQLMCLIMSIISFSSEGYLTYSLTFLLLTPSYICVRNNIHFDCLTEQTCMPFFNREGSSQFIKSGHFIDWQAWTSLHNWHELFDLRCKSTLYVSMFAGSYFLGQVFGTTALAHLGDRYGRLYILRRVMLASFVT